MKFFRINYRVLKKAQANQNQNEINNIINSKTYKNMVNENDFKIIDFDNYMNGNSLIRDIYGPEDYFY